MNSKPSIGDELLDNATWETEGPTSHEIVFEIQLNC